jgi:hypothetical protein
VKNIKNVFYSSNGLAYFWRAKHKQQIVFFLYFYVDLVVLPSEVAAALRGRVSTIL